MKRRDFLWVGAGAGLSLAAGALSRTETGGLQTASFEMPTYSVTPVVGDGVWIWTSPPKEKTGYLEPRTFDLDVGIELEGTGPATQLRATTAAPVRLPEQEVLKADVFTEGCEAQLRGLAAEAGQLLLGAGSIVKGQVLRAVAKYRLRIAKEHYGYERDQFRSTQSPPKDFLPYLIDSPGIQCRDKTVRDLVKKLISEHDHPWDKAVKFHAWVWENIKPLQGYFTSVLAALKNRTGDCEERAAVFVAFCRATGIPARLVWVPNHNWAEFWLQDEAGKGVWIPAHTSAYNWFGWTGAHELVLQKGDKVSVPEDRKPQRLLADWMQWQGSRPKVRFAAELRPVAPTETTDPGPGARSKDRKGEWLVVSNHPADRYGRK